MHLAKSMKGGDEKDKPLPDNKNPGPSAYQQNPINSIPGFVIIKPENAAKRHNDDLKKMEKMRERPPLITSILVNHASTILLRLLENRSVSQF